MRAAGFRLWRDHTGWASMGPLAAIPRIPKLLECDAAHGVSHRRVETGSRRARGFRRLQPAPGVDAAALRLRGPILDLFPPGTWLDNADKARKVSALTVPVTAFAHQYEFYRSLGCRIEYFGHPLASRYRMRDVARRRRRDGGIVAMLPGSRGGELRRHLPVLAAAYRALQRRAPTAARRRRRGRRSRARARSHARSRRTTRRRRDRARRSRGACARRRRVGRLGNRRAGNGALRRAGGRDLRHSADSDLGTVIE